MSHEIEDRCPRVRQDTLQIYRGENVSTYAVGILQIEDGNSSDVVRKPKLGKNKGDLEMHMQSGKQICTNTICVCNVP